MKKVVFHSTDGLKLAGIWHLPNMPTDKIVVLAHGANVDKDELGIFIKLAEALCQDNIAVFRFDFRGHGESDGDSIKMTIPDEIDDLSTAVQQVIDKGFLNIGLLGTSFGGGVATLYAANNQSRLKCLCLSNPVLNYDHAYFTAVSPLFEDRITRFQSDLKKQGWTMNIRFNKKYSRKMYEEARTLLPYEELQKIILPVLIIHGDKDANIPYQDSKQYINNVKNGKLVTISGSDHGFHEEPYQTQVINITVDFFKKYL